MAAVMWAFQMWLPPTALPPTVANSLLWPLAGYCARAVALFIMAYAAAAAHLQAYSPVLRSGIVAGAAATACCAGRARRQGDLSLLPAAAANSLLHGGLG